MWPSRLYGDCNGRRDIDDRIMSDLFVDNIKHQSSQGSGTITLGTSGEKITTASGAEFSAVTGHMYPAFEAKLSADQIVSDSVTTQVQFDSVILDTNSAYSTTNYRFTVPAGMGGKYFCYTSISGASNANSDLRNLRAYIYRNGSIIRFNRADLVNNALTRISAIIYSIIILEADDYIEARTNIDTASGTPRVESESHSSYFGAFRIGT